jgi:hypothetical protein
MLFVALLQAEAGCPKERIARRTRWEYPKEMKSIAEYWLQAANTSVVSVFETDTAATITGVLSEWGDMFDISVFPAITADEGLALAEKMM